MYTFVPEFFIYLPELFVERDIFMKPIDIRVPVSGDFDKCRVGVKYK